MIRTVLATTLIAAGLGLAPAAAAQTDSANFQVTANVVTTCRIEAGNTLDFGNYDPTSTAVATGSTTIRVRCTNGTTAPIALNDGQNGGGGDCTTRAMAAGGNQLAYGLYRTTGTGSPWGCAAGNSLSYTAANAAWSTLTVYGQIPAEQNAPVGSYTDTVTATVTF